MNRILTAGIFVLAATSAMALPSDDAFRSGPQANYPVSKPRMEPGHGDYPRAPAYAAADRLASEMTEPELACVLTGACKPQPKST